MLGTDESAQDIVQDAWVALCLQMQRQSPSWMTQAHLLAWLRTVVRNKGINYLKAQQRLSFLDSEDMTLHSSSSELPESRAVRADIYCALYQAIRSLRKPQRDVIVYRFFYGYSLPEIIRTLDLPLNTVKARLARGKKQLQHVLSEWGVERSDLAAWALKRAPQGAPGDFSALPG
jgi:RNA polymerase sigma-70 factor (ECF subfamily)